jgi:hypothetical protein
MTTRVVLTYANHQGFLYVMVTRNTDMSRPRARQLPRVSLFWYQKPVRALVTDPRPTLDTSINETINVVYLKNI